MMASDEKQPANIASAHIKRTGKPSECAAADFHANGGR
jgi:hypothetical protein